MHLNQLFPALLLANPRVAKVGHWLTTGVKETVVLLANQTGPTHMRNIEPLLRIKVHKVALVPRFVLVPKAVLILEIERSILEIERSTRVRPIIGYTDITDTDTDNRYRYRYDLII